MYVNEVLNIENIYTYSNDSETLQLIACTIYVYNRVILMITVYNAEGQLDDILPALDDILKRFPSNIMTILAGDINIDIMKQTTRSNI